MKKFFCDRCGVETNEGSGVTVDLDARAKIFVAEQSSRDLFPLDD